MNLYAIDKVIFLFLNVTIANQLFDIVMPFVTDADNWKFPLLAGWLALIVFGGKKGRLAALLAVLVLAFTDQVSSSILKPLIGRIRPCFAVDSARLLIKQSHSFSFPSSHAANNAALALLFSVFYPCKKWIFISMALLVGFSRIYVGVHYPADVAGGLIIGVLCGSLVLLIQRLVSHLLKKNNNH